MATKTVVITDVKLLDIVMRYDPGTQTVSLFCDYVRVDTNGVGYGHATFVMTLTAPQQTVLTNFVVNQLIPAIKTQKGFS